MSRYAVIVETTGENAHTEVHTGQTWTREIAVGFAKEVERGEHPGISALSPVVVPCHIHRSE